MPIKRIERAAVEATLYTNFDTEISIRTGGNGRKCPLNGEELQKYKACFTKYIRRKFPRESSTIDSASLEKLTVSIRNEICAKIPRIAKILNPGSAQTNPIPALTTPRLQAVNAITPPVSESGDDSSDDSSSSRTLDPFTNEIHKLNAVAEKLRHLIALEKREILILQETLENESSINEQENSTETPQEQRVHRQISSNRPKNPKQIIESKKRYIRKREELLNDLKAKKNCLKNNVDKLKRSALAKKNIKITASRAPKDTNTTTSVTEARPEMTLLLNSDVIERAPLALVANEVFTRQHRPPPIQIPELDDTTINPLHKILLEKGLTPIIWTPSSTSNPDTPKSLTPVTPKIVDDYTSRYFHSKKKRTNTFLDSSSTKNEETSQKQKKRRK